MYQHIIRFIEIIVTFFGILSYICIFVYSLDRALNGAKGILFLWPALLFISLISGILWSATY